MHSLILDKLAARHLVQSVDEDVARLVGRTMAYAKHDKKIAANPGAHVLPPLLLRWNCVLKATAAEVSGGYKQKTTVALAVTLHKYGLADQALTQAAVQAVDDLNAAVALSDDFARKAGDIKAFIATPPAALKRKPGLPDSITFHRARDVVSIRLGDEYFGAYVLELANPNESPVLEFYDGVFEKVPTLPELQKLPARGRTYDDGKARVSRYSVAGMKFVPDLANQVRLVSACVETPPANAHLEKPAGLYTVSDIFDIQRSIGTLFGR